MTKMNRKMSKTCTVISRAHRTALLKALYILNTFKPVPIYSWLSLLYVCLLSRNLSSVLTTTLYQSCKYLLISVLLNDTYREKDFIRFKTIIF